MKIIFMGTPDFAKTSLQALINSKHDITAVYTRTDKPRDRGKKISYSPVKELALKHNIPVVQPTSLKTDEAMEILKSYNPDCIVVAAYGMILPQGVLDLPKYGCINVHASLLPKYRGAAPINRCIMDGETRSGITIMQMDAGVDTGDMLLQGEVLIPDNMTASELHDALAETGGELIVKALDNIDSITPTKQDNSLATHAEKLTKSECEIDFTRSAKEIHNFIRGLADYPCAYTFVDGKRLKVYRAVLDNSDTRLTFTCGDSNKITLTEIQPENGKRMKSEDYLRGIK
ncbi:MAG: methionyl-tRNA formyltransferase [Oscillospiraceae bacterium]|nr:methionyl-tRNA formyltransferase [Oscillospiraceae bacterium]